MTKDQGLNDKSNDKFLVND